MKRTRSNSETDYFFEVKLVSALKSRAEKIQNSLLNETKLLKTKITKSKDKIKKMYNSLTPKTTNSFLVKSQGVLSPQKQSNNLFIFLKSFFGQAFSSEIFFRSSYLFQLKNYCDLLLEIECQNILKFIKNCDVLFSEAEISIFEKMKIFIHEFQNVSSFKISYFIKNALLNEFKSILSEISDLDLKMRPRLYYFAATILFIITKISYKIEYYNIFQNNIMKQFNSYFISYFKINVSDFDLNFSRYVKIRSIYFKIQEKYWNTENDIEILNEKNMDQGLGVKINSFSSFFLEHFNSYFYLFHDDKVKLDFKERFKNKSSSGIVNIRRKKSTEQISKMNFYLNESISRKYWLNPLPELTLYFNSKLMKWKSEMVTNSETITCRICELEIKLNNLGSHSFFCSQKFIWSKKIKDINQQISDIIQQSKNLLSTFKIDNFEIVSKDDDEHYFNITQGDRRIFNSAKSFIKTLIQICAKISITNIFENEEVNKEEYFRLIKYITKGFHIEFQILFEKNESKKLDSKSHDGVNNMLKIINSFLINLNKKLDIYDNYFVYFHHFPKKTDILNNNCLNLSKTLTKDYYRKGSDYNSYEEALKNSLNKTLDKMNPHKNSKLTFILKNSLKKKNRNSSRDLVSDSIYRWLSSNDEFDKPEKYEIKAVTPNPNYLPFQRRSKRPSFSMSPAKSLDCPQITIISSATQGEENRMKLNCSIFNKLKSKKSLFFKDEDNNNSLHSEDQLKSEVYSKICENNESFYNLKLNIFGDFKIENDDKFELGSSSEESEKDIELKVAKLNKYFKKKSQNSYDSEELESNRKIGLDDFEIVDTLSKGGFGVVYLARKKITNDYYAIKRINIKYLEKKNLFILLENEADILSNINNDYVVKCFYNFEDHKYIYFVMEYLNGGDLFNMLRKLGKIPEKLVKFYAAEVILALDYLHSNNIIHRDIKPQNIMINQFGHIKLADFGLSEFKQKNIDDIDDEEFSCKKEDEDRKEISKRLLGTSHYFAPEIINQETHGKEVDFWALGVMIFQLLTGYLPFNGENSDILFDNIVEKKINWPAINMNENSDQIDNSISQEAFELINSLLVYDPNKRLGSKGIFEFKNMKFFEDIIFDQIMNTKPPHIPKLISRTQATYFDKPEIIEELEVESPKVLVRNYNFSQRASDVGSLSKAKPRSILSRRNLTDDYDSNKRDDLLHKKNLECYYEKFKKKKLKELNLDNFGVKDILFDMNWEEV